MLKKHKDCSESEIIMHLKEKFKSCTKSSEKVLVLTDLPKSSSIRKIMNEFEASNYIVRKSKKLVEEKGILLLDWKFQVCIAD